MNLFKACKKIWRNWRYHRMLRDYYWSQSQKPRGESIFLYLLGFFVALLFVFRRSATFREALLSLAFLFVLLVLTVNAVNRRKFAEIKGQCQQSLIEKEFAKRLENTPVEEVLHCLREEIIKKYPVQDLAAGEDYLTGNYKGEKLAVLYRHLNEGEVLETKDVVRIVRHCQQKNIEQVRIFTNRDFSPKVKVLKERYPSLKVYNGDQLRGILKDSYLHPTTEQITAIVEKEISQRKKKLSILRNQALQSEKFFTYFVYSFVLLCLARLKVGVYYLNLIFGVLLLALAVLSIIRSTSPEEEEIVF
ncbi:MAG: hypothetical protein ACOY3J_06085 [Bacillota bacterium]|uniref:Restriction endonuclease type IV Mrr domain-containing protein n=1 Tax=Thermanaerosceptrum fracticalcis TaxID=1712410 RepID=A0A7G6DZ22_THEFR|nr:hypothetical protein [Thermanaerosceptrum fracticalcis]QNB45076.1 hypothetical protein BR63_01290 [Thermanaerosceptrum fracticalcis]